MVDGKQASEGKNEPSDEYIAIDIEMKIRMIHNMILILLYQQ
jgi:hypothetical protein